MDLYRAHVLVCGGTGCTSSGSHQLLERLEQQLKEKGLEKEVKVVRTGCFGLCEAGPVVIIYPEGTFYSRVKVEDVDEIVSEHLLKGRKVQHLVYVDHVTHESTVTKSLDEIGFYKQQKRIALKNCGVIDPENIDEYIAFDGYKALAKALTEMTREQVIQEARPRRRRLPHGSEVEVWLQQPCGSEVHRLQRGRGRPRRVHGSFAAGGRSPCGH